MKTHPSLFLAAAGCAMLFTAATAFADAKDYQVTGPVTALTDKVITVQKGKDLWELNRDATTKVTGAEIKVGDKVTVHYTMLASAVEDKGAAPVTKAAGPKKEKAAAAPAAAAPAKP